MSVSRLLRAECLARKTAPREFEPDFNEMVRLANEGRSPVPALLPPPEAPPEPPVRFFAASSASSATMSFSSCSAEKRSASLPSRSDSTSDATPRTSGHLDGLFSIAKVGDQIKAFLTK